MFAQSGKLVIWDLDDMFWRGTLSEELIVPVDANCRALRELAEVGIVSSICSRNDYEQARVKLIEMGLWDYFARPVIQWSAKGSSVMELIEDLHLRPVNVVFIDDNAANLADVAFHCPGITCFNR